MASDYTLGEHLESFVKAMVESGRYASASEVMRDGLRLIEERERLREAKLQTLRQAVQEGLDSGPATLLDMTEVRARGRRLRSARNASQA